jgi:hypothetical protein
VRASLVVILVFLHRRVLLVGRVLRLLILLLLILNRLCLSLFLALRLPYQPLLFSSLLFLFHPFLTLLALFSRSLGGLFLSRPISLTLLIEDL